MYDKMLCNEKTLIGRLHQYTECHKRIYGYHDAKLIPIVAMSANAFQDDVEHSIKAGMNKHISNPLTGESVIKEIKSML